ncbi:MAG: AFG1 family ATPase [Parvularculaceae bacterium]|nr:AFG1 family ATPase [Parvularculaceae bacterium]
MTLSAGSSIEALMRGPFPRYRELIDAGALERDTAQEDAAARLQSLSEALSSEKRGAWALFARRAPSPQGIYIWGAVGRGKSLLMDIFFNNTDVRPKRRVHFHEFMAETHDRIAAWRAADGKTKRRHRKASKISIDDPMPPVAGDIAADARLLCFDEFQVTDIADAMILGRLFDALFAEGVTIVATSNRRPDDLYKDGLNRQLFLPFIESLKARLDVIELDAARDYRLDRLAGAPVYYSPLGPEADAAMDRAWRTMIAGAQEQAEALVVKGRTVAAPRCARGLTRFAFPELCEAPLGAADYIAIVRRYGAVFIDRIPRMGPDKRNEAKRFVTLIDAMYESRTKLVCSADAPPSMLYDRGDGAFEFERTASRLAEMQTAAYLGAEHEMLLDKHKAVDDTFGR